jgi:hypothetical protein
VNTQISAVKSQKQYQHQQYEAYLAYLAAQAAKAAQQNASGGGSSSGYEDITQSLLSQMMKAEYEYALPIANFPWQWKLLDFAELVHSGGKLDLKSVYRVKTDDNNDFRYYKFLGITIRGDAPANILYGYLGTAYGIPNWALYGGGDLTQEGGVDDPMDKDDILLGIELYKYYHES